MALRTGCLLLSLQLVLGALVITSNGLGMEGVDSPGRGEGRDLLQLSNTNNPVIKFDDGKAQPVIRSLMNANMVT